MVASLVRFGIPFRTPQRVFRFQPGRVFSRTDIWKQLWSKLEPPFRIICVKKGRPKSNHNYATLNPSGPDSVRELRQKGADKQPNTCKIERLILYLRCIQSGDPIAGKNCNMEPFRARLLWQAASEGGATQKYVVDALYADRGPVAVA